MFALAEGHFGVFIYSLGVVTLHIVANLAVWKTTNAFLSWSDRQVYLSRIFRLVNLTDIEEVGDSITRLITPNELDKAWNMVWYEEDSDQ
ncbi:uncharacterized protein N7503_007162 [Penicillium pulvis]|uniref:uncharacterized protein n=1 Tax=Penicillium pulvis TaxID=1562058 RepID=UPI002547DF26|nr:uncharacterized protein N7503_007162 [Penicillium pulvis]KAJ5797866.1 hypothetical protein N7503_007162 [Penicillium pulvis]